MEKIIEDLKTWTSIRVKYFQTIRTLPQTKKDKRTRSLLLKDRSKNILEFMEEE
jgi:hypothetical protein